MSKTLWVAASLVPPYIGMEAKAIPFLRGPLQPRFSRLEAELAALKKCQRRQQSWQSETVRKTSKINPSAADPSPLRWRVAPHPPDGKLVRSRAVSRRSQIPPPQRATGWVLPPLSVLLALVFLGAGEPPGRVAEGSADDPAYHLRAGSVARSRIVVLGRDLRLDGEARSHAVVLTGSAHVTGSVAGDVIVLDGDAILGETARVGGDVYVLGGRIETAEGAVLGGRSVAYPDPSALWVMLIQGPTLGLPASSTVVIGAKLALIAFWAFVVLLLFGVARRELLATSEGVRLEPFRNFFLGLTGVAAMVLTALLFSAFSGAFLGVPLLVLVAVVALVLRFWGMVAVFHALGEWLCRSFRRPPPLPVTAATLGLLAFGVLKFLPYLGIWGWSIATFLGVGAALSTRLGRREVRLRAG